MRAFEIVLWGSIVVAGCAESHERPEPDAAARDAGSSTTRSCRTDDDCRGADVCLDIAEFDDGCHGRVCMQPCASQRDCAFEFDCEPLAARRFCIAYSWEDELCGG